MNTNTHRLFYSIACPTIITRAQWGGRQPSGTPSTLATPVNIVVIHHTVTGTGTTQAACAPIVRSIQNHHMNTNGWLDIGYNFLVCEDGNIYEGRGWTRVGAHAVSWNSRSIGIAVIGDFTSKPICTLYPLKSQLERLTISTDNPYAELLLHMTPH